MILFIHVSLIFSSNSIFGERQNWGKIEHDAINEASGIVSSYKNNDVFWTHNDSGDKSKLYAFDRTGKHLGVYRIKNCQARDWEDIAIGPGPLTGVDYLYIGNIGDNQSIFFSKYIYRCIEPDIDFNSLQTENIIAGCDVIKFQYEDGNRDAETLMIDPLTKDIIIVSKREEEVHIYNINYPQNINGKNTAELIGTKDFYPDIEYEGSQMITAGEISRNGKNIIIKSYEDVFLFKRNNNQSIMEAFNNNLFRINYIPEIQGEAVCFHSNEFGYFTVSEENINIESALYFYPKKKGCIDKRASNFNPFAEIGDRSCIYKKSNH